MSDDHARQLTVRYDREAAAYRELWAPILRLAASPLLAAVTGRPARRLVDVGTGVGSLLPDLRDRFPAASVLGVDRSRGMLALAPDLLPRAVMDATRLALPPASVDLALLVFVLFHLERPLDGLREARRVLRPGGLVASATWGGELESGATRVWNECLDAHGAVAPDPDNQARHDQVDTPGKMEALLRAAGFESVRSWTDELVAPIGLEHLLRLKTSMGSAKPRFDSLAPAARESCVATARRRLERLGAEDFVARGRIVYATASA